MLKTFFCFFVFGIYASDICFVSRICYGESLSSLSYKLIKELYHKFDISCIPTAKVNGLEKMPFEVRMSLQKKYNKPKISILFDHIWYIDYNPTSFVPINSHIKIAYSMIESDSIPLQWVEIINTTYDAIIVPTEHLKNIYKKCGIVKPIFVLMVPLDLNSNLEHPIKDYLTDNNCFYFFSTSQFYPWKNQEILIKAFDEEFKNEKNVFLTIHGKQGDYSNMMNLVNKIGNKNINIIYKNITDIELQQYMFSSDCYVLVSQGEGLSMTPREAMALGLPCLISNNSAHTLICESGLVMALNCNKPIRAYYNAFGQYCGNYYSCDFVDLKKALRNMYNIRFENLKTAQKRRDWVRKYTYDNLLPYFETILKPEKVLLDNIDQVDLGIIKTSSKELFKKYNNL